MATDLPRIGDRARKEPMLVVPTPCDPSSALATCEPATTVRRHGARGCPRVVERRFAEGLPEEPDAWESRLSGSERGRSTTGVWTRCSGTAAKAGGKRRTQISSCSAGSLLPTRSVVYLGEDTRLQRPVAIKALPAAFTHDAQFRRPPQARGDDHGGPVTPRHRHRVRIRGVRRPSLSRPRIRGGAHTPRGDRRGPAPARNRALDGRRCGAGVGGRSCARRDSPRPEAGERATDHGRGIKVVDFGLARFERGDAAVEERLTRAGGVLGTPGYMSPKRCAATPSTLVPISSRLASCCTSW